MIPTALVLIARLLCSSHCLQNQWLIETFVQFVDTFCHKTIALDIDTTHIVVATV